MCVLRAKAEIGQTSEMPGRNANRLRSTWTAKRHILTCAPGEPSGGQPRLDKPVARL